VEETDVLIIGAGLVGCASAYYLAQEGVECLVVDRGEVNREGSGTNAGSLHIQLRQTERLFSDEVLEVMVPMRVEAARIWAGLDRELGCDLGLKLKGGFLVAESDDELSIGQEMAAFQRRMGLRTEMLSRADMLAMAPHLSPDLKGATYSPDEGSANPLWVAPAFLLRAQARGARLRTYTSVTATEPQRGGGFVVQTSGGPIRARRVLNAAGPWSARLTEQVGVSLPLYGRVIQVNVTERREPLLGQMVGLIAAGLTLKQTTYGTFMIGGGWPAATDPRTGRPTVSRQSIEGNVGTALRVLPALRDVAVVRTWTGVIAHSLDRHGYRLQIFGELPSVPGYFVVSGGTLFTLGPLFARLACELFTRGKTSFPVEVYHPDRFAAAVAA
jgi:glycine/D-amino acid oxidase-like deaminating enzyme